MSNFLKKYKSQTIVIVIIFVLIIFAKTIVFQGIALYNTIVIKKGNTDEYTYVTRAFARVQLKDYENAIKDFDVVIAKGLDGALYHVSRGVAKNEISDNLGALNDFNTAIKKGFDSQRDERNAYYFRSLVYLDLNKPREALVYIEKAISLGHPNPVLIEARDELRKELSEK